MLDLSGNSLEGEIPQALTNLTNLETLALGENGFQGEIPRGSRGLSRLTRLKNLYLNENGLEGQIPRKLADLSLEFLYLHGNRFEGCTPRELKVLLERSFGYHWLGWVIPRFCESAEARDDGEVLEALFIATEGEPDEADKHSMISLHEDLLRRVPGLFSLINGPEEDFRKIWINGEYGVEQLELLLNADSSDMTVEQRTAQADIRRLIVFRDFVNKYRKVSGWRYRNNWMSDLPLSNWEGVTTDGEGRVIGLELLGNNLKGRIPAKIADLTRLKELDLGGNELEGPIPDALGYLTELEDLDLSGNNWYGDIPEALHDLASLKVLDFTGSGLSGHLSPELADPSLEELHIIGNNFEGCRPKNLSEPLSRPLINLKGTADDFDGLADPATYEYNLFTVPWASAKVIWTELATLEPEYGGLYSFMVRTLGTGLPPCPPDPDPHDRIVPRNEQDTETDKRALEDAYKTLIGVDTNNQQQLDIWNRFLQWLKVDQKGNLEFYPGVNTDGTGRVKTLKLTNGHELPEHIFGDIVLSGSIPWELGQLGEMMLLQLGDNLLEGPIPLELGSLHSLERVHHDNNLLTGGLQPALGNIGTLHYLDVRDNPLGGSFPYEIGNFSQLERIYIQNTGITGCFPFNIKSNLDPPLLSLFNLINPIGNIAKLPKRGFRSSVRYLDDTGEFFKKSDDAGGFLKRHNIVDNNIEEISIDSAKLFKRFGLSDAEAQEASKNIIEELLGGLRNVGYKSVAETFTFTKHAFGVFTSPVDIVVKPGAVGTPITGSQLGEVTLSCEEYD